MSEAPKETPKMAFVIMCNNQPCFSTETFERASERAAALMRGSMNDYSQNCYYRIEKVEAE